AAVGLVPYATVRQGTAAIRNTFDKLRQRDIAYAVIDAIEDEDLRCLGAACADLALRLADRVRPLVCPAISAAPACWRRAPQKETYLRLAARRRYSRAPARRQRWRKSRGCAPSIRL